VSFSTTDSGKAQNPRKIDPGAFLSRLLETPDRWPESAALRPLSTPVPLSKFCHRQSSTAAFKSCAQCISAATSLGPAQEGARFAAWFVEQGALLSAVKKIARKGVLDSVLRPRECVDTSGMVPVTSDVPVCAWVLASAPPACQGRLSPAPCTSGRPWRSTATAAKSKSTTTRSRMRSGPPRSEERTGSLSVLPMPVRRPPPSIRYWTPAFAAD
jgi:hypothetical protein